MKKIVKREFPVRRWSLEGFPGTGKSSFAARMRGPQVVVDADGRYEEVVHLVTGDVYAASDEGIGNVRIADIEKGLDAVVPKVKPGTIIVDSITQILNPVIGQMMMGEFEGNGQVVKAMLMRRLSAATCKWGCDVLMIYHLYEAGLHGKDKVTATVSEREQDRLILNLNAKLETVFDDQHSRYGIKVLWSRGGRYFPEVPILWDETGTWDGMPERIEKAIVNGGGSSALSFKSAEEAIAWAVNTAKAYADAETARKFYEQVKETAKPKLARDMWEAWIAHCQTKGGVA